MAVTVTHVKSGISGNAYEHVVDVAGPASYTTGGDLLTAAQVAQLCPRIGPTAISGAGISALVQHWNAERDATGRTCVLDRATGKVVFFAAGAEAGSASNQSAAIRVKVRYGMTGD